MKFLVKPLHNLYRSILRHPKYRWWVIAASLLYLVGPIDISPDVFPIVGWIDDGLIATLLVTEVSQLLVDRLKSKRTESLSTPSVSTPSVSTPSVAKSVANANTVTTIDTKAVSVG